MRCLRLLSLNLLVFAIGTLFPSCGNFFVDQNSINGTSTSTTITNANTTNGTGTTSGVTTTGTGTTGTTGTTTFAPTGGTGTTGSTGVGTITPTTGGTATTGTTGTGTTTPTTGGTGTTGTFGTGTFGTGTTGTVATGTTGTFGTGTTGTGTGTGMTGTGLVGLFAALNPRNVDPGTLREPGQTTQGGFLFGSLGKGISVGRIDPASGNVTGSHTGTGPDSGAFVGFMVPDPKGRFLFASEMPVPPIDNQHASGSIGVFAIDRTNGTLSPVSNGSIVSPGGEKISLDPTGRFLYTVIDDGIAAYSINRSSGMLTAIPGSPFGGNIGNLVVVSPDGKYLYNVGSGKASSYTLDSTTGKPTATGRAISTDAAPELDIAVSPSGKFLFIADRSTTIKVLSIGTDGTLMPLSPSPDIGHRDTSMVIHPSGAFLYVGSASDGGGNGGVDAFHVDSSGNVTSIGGSSYSTSANALHVTIDASGKYLYVSTPKGVNSFEIDQTTGELTSSSSSPAIGNLAYSQVIAAGP